MEFSQVSEPNQTWLENKQSFRLSRLTNLSLAEPPSLKLVWFQELTWPMKQSLMSISLTTCSTQGQMINVRLILEPKSPCPANTKLTVPAILAKFRFWVLADKDAQVLLHISTISLCLIVEITIHMFRLCGEWSLSIRMLMFQQQVYTIAWLYSLRSSPSITCITMV